MKIPFTCAFALAPSAIELLASDDNTNYASYLLNFGLALFFPARYKACRSMWKFSQLSAKNFPRNMTQNKVCICHRLCMYGRVPLGPSEFFSLWAPVFRKARCLPWLTH